MSYPQLVVFSIIAQKNIELKELAEATKIPMHILIVICNTLLKIKLIKRVGINLQCNLEFESEHNNISIKDMHLTRFSDQEIEQFIISMCNKLEKVTMDSLREVVYSNGPISLSHHLFDTIARKLIS